MVRNEREGSSPSRGTDEKVHRDELKGNPLGDLIESWINFARLSLVELAMWRNGIRATLRW